MRAKLVKESINFERGLDPKDAMGTGDLIYRKFKAKIAEITEENLNEAWAVCFNGVIEPMDFSVIYSESKFVIKTVNEFYANKRFMKRIEKKIEEFINAIGFNGSLFDHNFDIWKSGIKSPEQLYVFFQETLEHDTFHVGFVAIEQGDYEQNLEDEAEN